QPFSRSVTAARAPASPAPTMTIPRSAICPSGDVDEHFAGFNLDRIGSQSHLYRRPLWLAGAVVELSIMLGAFDDEIHDEAVSQIGLLVGTNAVGGIEHVVGRPIDR